MYKSMVFLCILSAASVCHAFSEISWWTVSAGKERVVEFLSEDIKRYCYEGSEAYSVAGRPDEIFVVPIDGNMLKDIIRGKVINGLPGKICVLNLKTGALTLMGLDRFLKLEILFEDLPATRYEKHPKIKYRANPEGHGHVSPVRRNGREFIAALSSERLISEKTTFGIPGIIPFFGRDKWFQKEDSFSGTFFLEIFDADQPAKPVVQLHKKFKGIPHLPSVSEMTSWTQGAQDPILVVLDHQNPIGDKRGRILVFRLR